MPQKPEKQPSFSIDDFIGEIEKAEDAQLNKRLPQERLKNKRQLDNAARRAAEAAGLGDGKLVPQPLIKKAEGPLAQPKPKKVTKSPVTGMTLKSPKSKANSVDRIDFGGMGEPEQAGFGHVPSSRITARVFQIRQSLAIRRPRHRTSFLVRGQAFCCAAPICRNQQQFATGRVCHRRETLAIGVPDNNSTRTNWQRGERATS